MPRVFRYLSAISVGYALAVAQDVIWFFEKDSKLVICEIRRAANDRSRYEFEVADAEGPKTQQFDSPGELIANYLYTQQQLIKDGWRPRVDLHVDD